MPEAGSAGEKLKVFISYSRRDSAEFADELVAGLEYGGFEPLLDRYDIVGGEDWEVRLGDLIASSDTVVFIVSPEAVKSERCVWEVDKTLALSKRLLPVVFEPVTEHDIPEKLRRLQFVRFDSGTGFARPLSQLAEALRVDLQWIREHTRLGELAMRWDRRGRPESLLLRGDDLDAAKVWVAARKAVALAITDAQRAFVKVSGEVETARIGKERAQLEVIRKGQEATAQQQRRTAWLLGCVAVLLGGSILGFIAWINQSFVKQQWNWYTNVKPYMDANVTPYVLSPQDERALKPLASFRECAKDCPEMIVIPAGEFTMGSPATQERRLNEAPQHKVTIAKPFAVSKFDVTFADWDACVSIGGCLKRPYIDFGAGPQPLIRADWDDAQQYVAWFSRMTGRPYRLLTEAEWEYAARAGTTTAYSWGDAIGKGNANCSGCGSEWERRGTSPVGSFKPNAFGLYDMAGNVSQWVQDCYHADYNGATSDGSAWTSGDCPRRVVRGGSWDSDPLNLRSATRSWRTFGFKDYNLGFRVGRTLTP